MYKFEIGQLVRNAEGRIYQIEDTAIDKDEKCIYLLKEVFHRYKYEYEDNLEAFHGTVFNETELRPQ